MTLERQKWWDSLPKEEKRARSFIAAEKSTIKVAKATINSEDCDVDYEKNAISASKQLLKLLRKEIAMDVIALHNSAYEYYTCPYCGQNVREGTGMRDEDNYCASCGQKLRWE